MALLECLLLTIMGSGGLAGSNITQPRVLAADAIVQPNGGVTLTGLPEETTGGATSNTTAKHRRHRKHRHGKSYYTPKKEGSLR